MTDKYSDLFFIIPTYLWFLLGLSIIALVTYFFSKNIKKMLLIVGLTFIISLGLMMLHDWDQYLSNHLVSSFDESGLPTTFTRNGWWLLIDAALLWLPPTVMGSVMSVFIYQFLAKKITRKTEAAQPQTLSSQQQIADHLYIQELKKRLEISEEKNRQLQLREHADPKHQNQHGTKNLEEIRQYRIQNKQLQQENARLSEKLKSQILEIERSNTLIDKLLNEKFASMINNES